MSKNRTQVNGRTIRKIASLHRKGVPSKEIQEFVDLSDSSVGAYVRVIDAAYGNGSFCLNPKVYNQEAVAEFCQMAGLPLPKNTYRREPEQLEMEGQAYQQEIPLIIETDNDRLISEANKALVRSVWHIHSELYAIAKSLELILKTKEEGKNNGNA